MSDCQIMSNIARVPDKWVAMWVKMVPGRLVGPVLLRLRAIIHVKSKGSEKNEFSENVKSDFRQALMSPLRTLRCH